MASKAKIGKMVLSTPGEAMARRGITMKLGGKRRAEQEPGGGADNPAEEAMETAEQEREEMRQAMTAKLAKGPMKRLREKRAGGG